MLYHIFRQVNYPIWYRSHSFFPIKYENSKIPVYELCLSQRYFLIHKRNGELWCNKNIMKDLTTGDTFAIGDFGRFLILESYELSNEHTVLVMVNYNDLMIK